MKLSALLSNINSILLKSQSDYKLTIDDVDFIVHHIFRLDIPDKNVDIETVEKIIAVCSKYPEFKTYEHLSDKKVIRLIFDMKNRMQYESFKYLKSFENFKILKD